MSKEKHSESKAKVKKKPYWGANELEYEDLDRYCDGGFCPVLIWQMFDNGRYRIAYKLGTGHFSTVWLAQDLQLERYVALKFLTAEQFEKSTEADMLRAIENSNGLSLSGLQYIICLLDSFDYESPNGKHHILVFSLSRPLRGLRGPNMNFPAIVKNLVTSLDCLHAVGIIHGGKLESFYHQKLTAVNVDDHRYPYLKHRIQNRKFL